MNYFVISDIHGCLRQFNKLLENFNSEKEHLILLGDYIDRKDDSLGVLKRIIELKKQYPSTVVLKGNHEMLFLDLIHNNLDLKTAFHYLKDDGGKATIESLSDHLLDTSDISLLKSQLAVILPEIHIEHKEIIEFIKTDLQNYYVTENILFTHAGYDTTIKDWRKTEESKFYEIRGHYQYNPTNSRINVFGHTPVRWIRENMGYGESDDPLFIKGAYLAIDGACFKGGQLNGIVLNEKGELIHTYSAW